MIPQRCPLVANDDLATIDTTLGHSAYRMELHLVKAPFVPGPQLQLADLVEADFPGYVAQLKTNVGVIDLADGSSAVQYGDATFTAVGAQPGQRCFGWFALLPDASLAFAGAQLFDHPIPITAPGDFITVQGPLLQFVLAVQGEGTTSTH